MQERKNLADRVFETMSALQIKITSAIYDDIQNQANLYFQEMTRNNNSMGGNLILDRESSEVYTVDEGQDSPFAICLAILWRRRVDGVLDLQ